MFSHSRGVFSKMSAFFTSGQYALGDDKPAKKICQIDSSPAISIVRVFVWSCQCADLTFEVFCLT